MNGSLPPLVAQRNGGLPPITARMAFHDHVHNGANSEYTTDTWDDLSEAEKVEFLHVAETYLLLNPVKALKEAFACLCMDNPIISMQDYTWIEETIFSALPDHGILVRQIVTAAKGIQRARPSNAQVYPAGGVAPIIPLCEDDFPLAITRFQTQGHPVMMLGYAAEYLVAGYISVTEYLAVESSALTCIRSFCEPCEADIILCLLLENVWLINAFRA
ncbi:hypothetical protein CYLTODRAFT_462974 [Cylindrobasidium torrendii FP15055 ss-10]|uniref:Uncharacterized protein n=1 Tax=Cylindrobasidium torrendii FP15055 ss-10 TaxID=1314674 RepID=A0A0D7B811_9AGAR|nr:hypothetical protein CYLTODRAFT_462974 [Cylindrobasidium torrendii FP15055 ss-10]